MPVAASAIATAAKMASSSVLKRRVAVVEAITSFNVLIANTG